MLGFIKIVGPVVALFGVFKILTDVFNAKSSRRRENYKLTKDFLVDLEGSNENHFLIQSGFLALTGLLISVDEIKYLISRNNSLLIIDLKPTSNRYIEFDKDQSNYYWKKKYGTNFFQKYGWWFFHFIYASFITFAMLPHLGGVDLITIRLNWVVSSLIFFVLAIYTLNLADNFKQTKKFIVELNRSN